MELLLVLIFSLKISLLESPSPTQEKVSKQEGDGE
jgi:hypothetical protein